MAFELNEGQGSLFANDKKQSENSPDYTGKVKWGGVERRLAGWKKKSRDGKPFLSVQMSDFQPRDGQQQSAPQDDVPPPASEDDYGF